MIHQDYEHEAQRDLIYLQEEMQLLKEEINQEKERLAAKILVIKEEDKIRENEKHIISTIPGTT